MTTNNQFSFFNSLASLNHYLVRYKKKLLLGLLFIVLTNIFNLLGPFYIGIGIDSLRSDFKPEGLFFYAFLVVVFAIGRGVFLFLVRQTIIVVSREIEFDLRNDLYDHIQVLPMSFFQTQSTGDIIAKNTNDINAVRSYLGPGIMYSSNTIATFLFIIPTMAVINWQLTLLALLPLPLMSYLVFKMGRRIHEKYADIQEQYAQLTTRVQENLSGIRIIKSYVRELFEVAQFDKLNQEYFKKNINMVFYQAFFVSGMAFFIGLSMVLIIWFGGYQVISEALTLGNLAQFIVYVGMLVWPMIALGWVINIMQQASAAQERLNSIFDQPPAFDSNEEAQKISREIQGDVEFRNVSFFFPNVQKSTLDDISFTVNHGETLAITGHTGSGKSTIVKLLLRLNEVSSGQIYIDQKPIQSIPIENLRLSIGYVPQESFLFSDSLKNNIGYALDHPELESVIKAAIMAQLHENIVDFQDQYDTHVGERGITLSGGQKQRASIARAIMTDPKILVLDDCLSAVDTHTEDQILKALRVFMKGRTSILISHRISTIKDADKILVIDQGRIVESGSHDQLLKMAGHYYNLYQKQLLEEELKAMS